MADENESEPVGSETAGAAAPPPPARPSRWDRFLVWTARRPVQLVAVGLAGALVGGALVGFLGALSGDRHEGGRHGFYGPGFAPAPYMRGPGWRMRQWNGVPPWQQGPGPGFANPSPSAIPTATVTVTPSPSKS